VPPWLFLALLVSLLAALGYQIIMGRSLRRVPLYWSVVLAGFLGAEAAAESINLHSPRIGELQVFADLLGMFAAIGILRLARL
jgi:hypothetical protein